MVEEKLCALFFNIVVLNSLFLHVMDDDWEKDVEALFFLRTEIQKNWEKRRNVVVMIKLWEIEKVISPVAYDFLRDRGPARESPDYPRALLRTLHLSYLKGWSVGDVSMVVSLFPDDAKGVIPDRLRQFSLDHTDKCVCFVEPKSFAIPLVAFDDIPSIQPRQMWKILGSQGTRELSQYLAGNKPDAVLIPLVDQHLDDGAKGIFDRLRGDIITICKQDWPEFRPKISACLQRRKFFQCVVDGGNPFQDQPNCCFAYCDAKAKDLFGFIILQASLGSLHFPRQDCGLENILVDRGYKKGEDQLIYIAWACIKEDLRGRGLGKRMCKQVVDLLRHQMPERNAWIIVEYTKESKPFWEKLFAQGGQYADQADFLIQRREGKNKVCRADMSKTPEIFNNNNNV